MKLVEKVLPSQGYMVLQKAPGTTVKHAFEDLKTKIGNWNPRTSDSTCYTTSSKMASGIEALASKWIEEGIFGSLLPWRFTFREYYVLRCNGYVNRN